MLLTVRELEQRKQEGVSEKIVSLPVEKPSVPEQKVYRMFHPDSTDRIPISCEFALAGVTIKLVRGVAEVPENLAPVLEKSGWIKGKKLDKEWDEA